MTDEARCYGDVSKKFTEHQAVNHAAEEWVSEDAHTNTLEGCFGLFKHGMKGVYQHCSEKHLHRYLAEFDFRYNNRVRLGVDDAERAHRALAGFKGKRLLCRQPNGPV